MDRGDNGTSIKSSYLCAPCIAQYTLYCILIVIGCAGNLFIMFAVLNKKPRKRSEYCILNLAITDLGASVISIPLDLVERIAGGFPFGSVFCYIIYPFQTVLMAVSVITLLLMSLERLRAVMCPLRPMLRKKGVLIAIYASWSIPVVVIIPYTLVLRLEDSQCTEKWPEDWYVKVYTLAVFFLFYVVPLIVITISYVRAGLKLHQNLERIQAMISKCQISRSQEKYAKKRALQKLRIVRIFVAAVIAFALCMLPTHMAWIWHDFGEGWKHPLFKDLLVFANILTYINSVINPFIFGTIKASSLSNIKAFCLGNLNQPILVNPLTLRTESKRCTDALKEPTRNSGRSTATGQRTRGIIYESTV